MSSTDIQILIVYIFFIGVGSLIAGSFFYFAVQKLIERRKIIKSLSYVLYQVELPQPEEYEPGMKFKDVVSVMEQFLNGMSAIKEGSFLSGPSYFVLELALPVVGEETTFYVAVSKGKGRIFEKQLQSLFPHARTQIKLEDYNIFNPEGISMMSVATLKENPVLPIRTYEKLDSDPLEVIANAFSKIKAEGEGASLQILINPEAEDFSKKVKSAAQSMRKGESLKKSSAAGWGGEIINTINALITGGDKTKQEEDKKAPPPIDEETAKLIEEKSASSIAQVNIRLVASAKEKQEAQDILGELESAFLQFIQPQGNSFSFRRLKGKELKKALYQFSFRFFSEGQAIYLNTKELTSIYHFPSGLVRAPKLKFLKAKDAPPPVDLPKTGLLLGKNIYRDERVNVYIERDDRRRHLYLIGQTGVGKTVLLENMIKQDIQNGEGVCVIDPHGDMVREVLGHIPEKRIDEVIYFDPADTARPFGLNFLEYDISKPEMKTFIVNELLEIFQKLYKDVPESLGPMFEQYFRNATMLVMEDISSGNTLLEIGRVMSDKNFRELKLSRSKNPVVNAFWRDVAEKAGGEAALSNMAPYITSKFDTFLTNEIMRPILMQQYSSINFREILDKKKIFLVNLSKGRLGDLNANLLGLIIVGRLLIAALSRADMSEDRRQDYYLYIDEFQNVTTKSIATILSEARKYRLNLVMAHQFIAQLSDEIKNAVFGNIGSIMTFRVGTEDAQFLEKYFEPVFSARDLMNIENFQAYVKLLIRNQTSRPFNIKTMPPQKGNETLAEAIKELSSQKYGRPRAEVEADIAHRYQK